MIARYSSSGVVIWFAILVIGYYAAGYGVRAEQEESLAVVIHGQDRMHRFVVEVARTPEEQARGLMFRHELDDHQGMLFPFEEERRTSFWMKNTYIPLDILFIDQQGRIVTLIENALPESLAPIASRLPVIAVLEIKGGSAGKLGIREGDKVTWDGVSVPDV